MKTEQELKEQIIRLETTIKGKEQTISCLYNLIKDIIFWEKNHQTKY